MTSFVAPPAAGVPALDDAADAAVEPDGLADAEPAAEPAAKDGAAEAALDAAADAAAEAAVDPDGLVDAGAAAGVAVADAPHALSTIARMSTTTVRTELRRVIIPHPSLLVCAMICADYSASAVRSYGNARQHTSVKLLKYEEESELD